MRIIGDVHGEIEQYKALIKGCSESIQIGDMGCGFVEIPDIQTGWNRWFRGNHDNPELSRKHPNYLGEWGTTKNDIFYAAGAYSIDRHLRTAGINWWPDEQLSRDVLEEVKASYLEKKPEIVLTHACPEKIKQMVLLKGFGKFANIQTWTETYFQEMFEGHQPKLWVFGHLHIPFDAVVEGTRFVCLDILKTMDI